MRYGSVERTKVVTTFGRIQLRFIEQSRSLCMSLRDG